jgi:superfamily II DNA or RNA helicase
MMKHTKILFTGATGSGKTYRAIERAGSLGKFAYLAPCRQLVYETAIKYGSFIDSINTGEVKLNGTENGNLYAVYESNIDYDKYNTIVIDEAHFLTDEERGERLNNILKCFKKNIILLTATRTFATLPGYKRVNLPSMVKFQKRLIDHNEFFQRVEDGISSILFRKYKNDCGLAGGAAITADTTADDRLEIQLAFTKGEINFVECTNVLAQGLNFPCENLCVESNEYDSDALIHQKLGRLGRYGITRQDTDLTYHVAWLPGKINKTPLNKVTYVNRKVTFEPQVQELNRLLKEGSDRFTADQTQVLIDEMRRWNGMSYHVVPYFSYMYDNFYVEPSTKYAVQNLIGVVDRLKDTLEIANLEEINAMTAEYRRISDNVAKIIKREWAAKANAA